MHTEKQTEKKNVFAFGRANFVLLAIGMTVVVAGMILMTGSGSDETTFNPAIFDARHIKVAPAVCLFGYLFIIVAILHRPRAKKSNTAAPRAND